MALKGAARAEADRLMAAFRAAGAVAVEADILQPAEVLLDLYGEDIRGRAYVTADPIRGEMMLRPDFTVPVVQMHMAGGAEPARYCYLGEVFRKQEHLTDRKSEYFQVGYEIFDRENPVQADAEVFALFAGLLAPLNLRAVTGDIAILMDAVRGLKTLESRKAALLRHIWRPRRFTQLLDRFGGRAPVPATRARLLETLARGNSPVQAPLVGLRSEAEIAARLAALQEDAAAAPIAAEEVTRLNDLLNLSAKSPAALAHLRDLARDMPAIAPATDRMEARLEALAAKGVAVDDLDFEASHGRTTLEYYDGFVFSFHGLDPDLPPIASGGRYDALTEVLGQGRSIPAVGGVIRPGLVADLTEGAPC
ncbi:ATP phosphoribosyltransferase regulatory subunit [Defluviimonas sp. WL0050]|uniref:ATP phosphoribosyltransferase regulatory subunit n=1 Tax=Albidovulum litorale TaxID=2984134 RepID=A0ABT2ZJI6_9RHOB|nr:ATP phosphoribosyltransferase regulatory subunit [Defluviimonas sp. WL0050]MCV2871280.1 ATP phosphoribosyltransferase regulatory subunit [Defluviimonas sp. WL0050]